MNILVAEDEPVTRKILEVTLRALGHTPVMVSNGQEAFDNWILSGTQVIVSDWHMPELDGLDLCRQVRKRGNERYTYFIILTVRSGRESFLTAMESGVDDFITKPVDHEELAARLQVAERILNLRDELYALEGLLPICSYCKRIRNAEGTYGPLEGFIEKHSRAEFSHGICPDCYQKHIEPQLKGP